MKIQADEHGFAIQIEGERMFYFPLAAAYELDGVAETHPATAFAQEADGYCWTAENGTKYRLTAEEGRAVLSITLRGEGKLGRVEFLRTGEYDAAGYFSPAVRHRGEVAPYKAMNLSDDADDEFFNPAPLCYVFAREECSTLLGISLVAKAGEYLFDRFTYRYEGDEAVFCADYMEYTRAEGEYHLPDVVFLEGVDRYDVLRKYAGFHREKGYLPKPKQKEGCDWWEMPILCGWGDQWTVAASGGSSAWDEEAVAGAEKKNDTMSIFDRAIALSREDFYRELLKRMEEKEIPFGTLILDCKWQKTFGNMEADPQRWPDLRRFIDEMHGRGKKVLLWLNFYSEEGLPEEECILSGTGKRLCLDPTHPAVEKRTQEVMRRVLSDEPGCYNADGFKVDFVHFPKERGMRLYRPEIAGIELIKLRAGQIYEEAKKIKPEALITSQHVHPYFADEMDMMRIGDYYAGSNRAKENLYTRVGVLQAVLPGMPADTDSPSAGRRHDSLTYFRHSVKLGVPSIYGVEIYDRFLREEDWRGISELYRNYIEDRSK